jgi:hypothetical protein
MRYPVVFFLMLLASGGAQAPAHFRQHTLATDLKGGYQVLATDLNRDGKPDLIALASNLKELVWFENPGWERHVLATGRSRMINLDAWDMDRDGIPEIVLAEEFSMDPRKSLGILSLLKHQGDPRQPWAVTEIDRLPASHRVRWADIEGRGQKVLINAPLAGATSEPPAYKQKVPLVYYRPGEWKRELISDALEGVLHGIFVTDWDRDGRDEVLTASFLGIHLFHHRKDGTWTQTELTRGSPEPWPKCGSSDVAVGWLARRHFLCAIEPWHGNQVVVYTQQGKTWRRQVIDESLANGHTIQAADLTGDGRDEIIAGGRDKPYNLYIYTAEDAQGTHWSRKILDEGGMGPAACAVADLNGDRRPDIACISSSTLKWYENLGSGGLP